MNIKLIKDKTFAIFIGGKAISVIGSNIQQFALSLYVYAQTGSATLFATMLSISILPRLLFSPVAGVFGDWFDRKKTIVRLDFFNAMILGLYALYFMNTNHLEIFLIYILVVVLEIGELFYESAAAAIIPSIVEKEDIPAAKSLQSIVINIGRLLSPMLGAAIYGTVGLLAVLVINGLSFLIAALFESFMKIPALHKRPESLNIQAFFTDLKEGFIIIRDHHLIRTIIILATIINFIIGPFFTVGFIVIIIDVLGASEFQFGLFQSTLAASLIAGPMFIVGFIRKFDIAKVCFVGFIIAASLTISMALIPSSWMLSRMPGMILPFTMLLALSFLVGLTVSVINITIASLFATTVPTHAIGRASSVMNLLVTMFIPIGQITYGILLDNIAPSFIMIVSGLIVLFTVLAFRHSLLKTTDATSNETKKGMISDEVHVS